MNWDQVKGNWNQVKGQVKQQYGALTNDDLTSISGRRDEFVGKIQERYGLLKEEAESRVDAFVNGLKERVGGDAADDADGPADESQASTTTAPPGRADGTDQSAQRPPE